MDLVEQVREMAGGSLLDASLGGDRRAASTIGAGALARRATGDGPGARSAQVAAGLAALLSGHAARADRLLTPVADMADPDPGTGGATLEPDVARAVLYRHLARWHRWLLLPGGGGNVLMTECVVRYDLPGLAGAAEAARPALLAAGGGDPRWELEVAQVLDVVWCLTNVDGSELATGGLVSPGGAHRILGALAHRVEEMADLADRAGASAATDLALARYYRAAVARGYGDPGAAGQLQALFDAADAAGDHVTAGSCLLRAASWHTAPLGGAHVLDLAVQESGDAGIDLAPPFEAREAGAGESAAAAAEPWVAGAADRFARAGAARGRASAALHRSHLAFLRDQPDRMRAAAADADRWARASDDRRLTALAWVHGLVGELAGGGSPLDLTAARGVGRWGGPRGDGSFAHSLGIGLLLCRLARHWATRRDEPRGAELLLRLAREVFAELGADTNRLQSEVGSGDAVGAVGIAREQTRRYQQALEGYLGLVARGRAVQGDDRRRARLLAVTLQAAAPTTGDPDRIAAAGDLIARTLTVTGGPPDGGDLVELLRAGDTGAFEHGITGRQLALARSQLPLTAAVLTGQQARRAGDDERAAAAFDEALALAEHLEADARPFWRAFVLSAADRVDEAAAAYDAYLAGGGHDGAIFDELTAPLAEFGPAGAESTRTTAHANDRDAARFHASLRRFDQARTHLEAAAATSGDEWWQRESPAWDARALIAEVDAGLGDLTAAQAGYDDAIARLEREEARGTTDEERSALSGRRSGVLTYAGAAVTAARRGDDRRAFELLERGKARALVDLVRTTHRVRDLPEAQRAALGRWRQASARIAALRRLLAVTGPGPVASTVTAELDRLLAQVDALAPDLLRAGLIGAAPADAGPGAGADLDVDRLAAALPAGTALVTWLELRHQLLTAVVTGGGGVRTHLREIGFDEVTALLNRFTAVCRTGGDPEPLGERLGELLLAPVAAELADAEHVVFVPWGAGNQAPLHALPFAGGPLVAERAVSYLPTAALVPLLQRRGPTADGDGAGGRPEPGALLAVGDPDAMAWQPPGDGETHGYPPLPFARTEAMLVARDRPGATVLVGAAATEAAVRAALPGRRLVHLATHGCLVDGAPQLSAVLLAGGGHLTVDELVGMDLDADLVVLSACDTGRGEVTDGNEVLGLARTLLGAGARAALVSLWKAPDLATCLLMRRFHDQLRTGTPGPHALAAAQRELAATTFDAQLDEYLALPEVLRSPAAVTTNPAATRGAATPLPPPDGATRPSDWAPFAYLGIE